MEHAERGQKSLAHRHVIRWLSIAKRCDKTLGANMYNKAAKEVEEKV